MASTKLQGSSRPFIVPTLRTSLVQLMPAVALMLMVAAVYIPAGECKFIWDDDEYVVKQPVVHDIRGLEKIWFDVTATPQYYPLVFTSFWAEFRAGELRPSLYHWDNIVLHGLNAVLLWGILRRLRVPGSWFAAAIFAVHPVHVESVAWITERKNVLSGFFYLSALLAYLHFRPLEPGNGKGHWAWYALAVSLFVCALLSKTITCSLPAALFLLIWWKRGRVTWRDALPLVPLFIVGLWFGLLTVWLEKYHVRAEGKDWHLSFIDRCLIASRALWFYAGKLLWPADLTFIYPRWKIDPHAWWQYAYPLAFLGLVGALRQARHQIGRGPLVAVLYFAGTLVPALGFFDVYPMRFSFVANHFQYLASIGVIALSAAILTLAFRRLAAKPVWLPATAAAALLLVLGRW